MQKFYPYLFVILLLVFGGTMAARHMNKGAATPPGVSQMLVGNAAVQPSAKLSILFIGNSYIFTNDMPGMIAQIASSDTNNNIELEMQSIAKGGLTLMQHWKEGQAAQLIQSKKWDYVVLQDHSLWAMQPPSLKNAEDAVTQFDQLIKQNGSKTILFMTWARKPGSDWYSRKQFTFLKNYENMHAQTQFYTNELGKLLGATVIPIGDYWAYASKSQPTLSLYAPDAQHPSVTGTYMNAMLFYRFFTGRTPETVGFVPGDVSIEDAEFVKQLASIK